MTEIDWIRAPRVLDDFSLFSYFSTLILYCIESSNLSNKIKSFSLIGVVRYFRDFFLSMYWITSFDIKSEEGFASHIKERHSRIQTRNS